MRKNRNIVVLICSIIMVLGVLAGCSSQNASTGSSTNAGANATQAVQATQAAPEVTPSSAVEVASSEAQQPASQESTAQETASSAEAVVDNENVIDGIDFTTFHNLEVPLDVCLEQQNVSFDKLTAIVTIKSKVIQISHDGDSYVGKKDSKIKIYYFGAKKIEKIESDFNVRDFAPGMGKRGALAVFDENYTGGENEKITCTVTYEDGTTESITMYFTLD